MDNNKPIVYLTVKRYPFQESQIPKTNEEFKARLDAIKRSSESIMKGFKR